MKSLLQDLWQRRPYGAGRTALSAYRGLSLGTRVHSTIRWWSAPFPAVEAALPATGRILEIGCGHGLFTTYVALAGVQPRAVQGVDIDAQKIAEATEVAARLEGEAMVADLRFEVATSGAVAAGPWDAIVIVDMLYLLPASAQRELLIAAAAELAAGGTLLVKEMSGSPRWKARWNVFQETLSVSILGITERDGQPDPIRDTGPRFTFVDTETMAGWLRDLGLVTTSRRLDRHRIHPHHLLIGRRPSPEVA